MKIVIPMAGYGTRLRPHTWSKPKPLVPAAGKPVLGHVLDMFAALPSVDEIIFIVGYLGDQVEGFVKQAYPELPARYVVQEEMLGQSHAIWLAREGLAGPMLMVFVDTIIETDLSALKTEKADAVTWVKQVPDPRRFGVAQVDANGFVQRLIEKPSDMSINLAVVGFYYFREAEDLLAAIEAQMSQGTKLKGEYFLADAVNLMLADGLQMRVEPVNVWLDCGKPETLLETNRYLLEHGRDNSSEAEKREGVVVVPPVYVDPTAQVRHSVIGPHVTISADCEVERAIIRDSIIDRGAHISASTLSASLIGRGANIAGRDQALNVGDSADVGWV
jgi:glucose-1-phosphate thymidylyltransferase